MGLPGKEVGMDHVLRQNIFDFVRDLEYEFGDRRRELLEYRLERQESFDCGTLPDFLKETQHIREDLSWKVAEAPEDLRKRWVEITGPASSRKMVINAFNSGANAYMADFEDSESPTFENILAGQGNLYDAVHRTITFTSENPYGIKKQYALNKNPATLFVRPRGWHLEERHVKHSVTEQPFSASLFDFGVFFVNNAKYLRETGSGPYFYLPKMQSHLEARLWNDVFNFAQDQVGIPRGTIRATVLIETLPAVFEMEEILYELREHSAGLNCGRWDYIFSFIKTLQAHSEFVLPDRSQVTMDNHFLRSYVDLLIQICHKRGAYAIGGMAAQIPLKDPVKNEEAIAKVIADKRREVRAGHDGTWVAHPGLVEIAREAFKGLGDNQLHRLREDVHVTAKDLLTVPEGTITYEGLKTNISVGIQYLETWLSGTGCVPLYGLMEDAATAEISRTQIWQWLRHGARLDDGREITKPLVYETVTAVLEDLEAQLGEEKIYTAQFASATRLFVEMVMKQECPEFLTLHAYSQV